MVTTTIRVISLEKSVERRNQFRKVSEDAGVPWEFFSAREMIEAPLAYDEKLSICRFGRALTKGEIGVYTSHYLIWQDFLASNADQLIVLEDDVVIDWKLLRRLADVDLATLNIHILKLFATHPFPFDVVVNRFLSPHSHVLRVRGLAVGAQSYVATRRAAETLLAVTRIMFEPVDWAMSRYWSYGVTNYCLFPFPVFERFGQSTLQTNLWGSTSRPSRKDRIQRFIWRTQNRLAREYVNRIVFERRPFGERCDVGQAYVDRWIAVNGARLPSEIVLGARGSRSDRRTKASTS
jgi:glycosyl transferase, family 25